MGAVTRLASACAALASLAAVSAATPFINVNATSINNLDWVHVTYGGLTSDQASRAWIGLFSPSDANVSAISPLAWPATSPWTSAAPVKFIELSTMGTNGIGSGAWDFELINMYTDAVFWLFAGSIDAPIAVAKSQAISFKTTPPLRAHLTRTPDVTQMQVTWNTASNDDVQVVKYGKSSGVYTSYAKATAATYTRDQMCGEPANSQGWFDPHFWNTALMTGLVPATTYYYVYGSDKYGWSEEASFTSGIPTAPNTPVNVFVYADMGMTELDGTSDHWAEADAYSTARHMIDRMSEDNYTLALHVGDVSYATGYEAKWYLFDERYSGLASRIPVMMSLGNHERDWPDNVAFYNGTDSGGECGVSTTTRYPMVLPAGASDPLRNGWYTVTHGPMTTIMLNSELPVDPSSAQYAYLQSALAAVNRTITPWLFVAFHRPMYYGGVRDPNFGQFESLLMQYKVDIVFTGHEHYAQVTCPVYRSQCVSAPAGQYDAPVHVIIGNAGQTLTPSSPDPMLRYQNSEYGYSTLHIKSAQHLEMNFYADDTNALHYTLTLDRTYPRSA